MIRKRFYAEFDIIALASPAYVQKAGMPRTPQDLLSHSCVRERGIFDPGISACDFQKQREKIKVDVNGTLIVNDMQMSLSTVLDGVGVGYYPASLIASYLKEGRLVQVIKGWTWKSPGLFLYYSSRRQMPTPLKVSISFIEEHKELIGNLTPAPFCLKQASVSHIPWSRRLHRRGHKHCRPMACRRHADKHKAYWRT